jgi:hypothetical protein
MSRNKADTLEFRILDHDGEIAALRAAVESQQKQIADLIDALREQKETVDAVQTLGDLVPRLVEQIDGTKGDVFDVKSRLTMLPFLLKKVNDHDWKFACLEMQREPETTRVNSEGSEVDLISPLYGPP